MRSDQNNSNLIISSNDRLDLLDNLSLKDNILRSGRSMKFLEPKLQDDLTFPDQPLRKL